MGHQHYQNVPLFMNNVPCNQGNQLYLPQSSLVLMSVCLPALVLLRFVTDNTPRFIQLAEKRHIDMGNRWRRYSLWYEF
jgi:hypothetical protein